MRRPTVNYQGVEKILLDNDEKGGRPLTTREIRDLLGGHGCLTKISTLAKEFYKNNHLNDNKNEQKLQNISNKILIMLKDIIHDSQQELELAARGLEDELKVAAAEIDELEGAAESQLAELEETRERLRAAEAKVSVLESALRDAMAELANALERPQEALGEALREVALFRRKYEALVAGAEQDEPKRATAGKTGAKTAKSAAKGGKKKISI